MILVFAFVLTKESGKKFQPGIIIIVVIIIIIIYYNYN